MSLPDDIFAPYRYGHAQLTFMTIGFHLRDEYG